MSNVLKFKNSQVVSDAKKNAPASASKPIKAGQEADGRYRDNAQKMVVQRQADKVPGVKRRANIEHSNLTRVQGQWETRNEAEPVEGYESRPTPDDTCRVFLCHKPSTAKSSHRYPPGYYVWVRNRFLELEESFRYEQKADAIKAFQDLVDPDKDVRAIDKSLKSIEDFYDTAKKILSYAHKVKTSPGKQIEVPKIRVPRRLAFFFALEELAYEGFDEGDLKWEGSAPRNKESDAIQKHRWNRRFLVRLLGNYEIEATQADVDKYFIAAIELVASRKNGTMTYSMAYTRTLCYKLVHVAEICSQIPDFFPEFRGSSVPLPGLIKKKLEDKRKANLLHDKKRHPPIPIERVKKLLDIAWDTSHEIYYYTLGQLALGLRPTEYRRLIERPKKYIQAGYLNYQGTDLIDEEFLIVKSMAKIDITELPNPRLSIISRILLQERNPKLEPIGFFAKGGLGRQGELAPYYERCLRTTSLTFLVSCINAKNPLNRATYDDAKVRGAHVDASQVMETYAKHLDSKSKHPEVLFGLSGLEIDKTEIGDGSSLWDLWLLNDFLERESTICKSEKALGQLMEMVFIYAKEYKRDVFGETDLNKLVKKWSSTSKN